VSDSITKTEPPDMLVEAVAIIRKCEEEWGCECPYCDRDYGESFIEHATETNGAGFVCRIGAFLERAAATFPL